MPNLNSLTNIALDALEEELRCWQRIGSHRPQMTRLHRYPPPDLSVAGAGIPPLDDQVVIMEEVPDRDVNQFLTRMAMEKVVIALGAQFRSNLNVSIT